VNLYARDVTERKRTDLSELVERVLTLSGKELANGGVEVEVQTGEESALVMAVPDRLHQVFLNLVLNALDAMPEGGRLTLQLEPTETPEGVTVSVADTGVGMPAEVRERIFTPFYTTKKDGVGLGLYVTQNIIADHGGAIRVESEVDAGTIFHVWLPEGGVAEQVQESDTPES
jgi:signal transduction histidine kinase